MPTVLLVEDNEDNQMIYRDMLEHAGYRVIAAADGEEGVNAACELQPDVILMDLSMPVIDGVMAMRLLKADPRTRAIPIIAVTAHAMDSDRRSAMAAGFDAYVPKPATPRAVLEEVRRWVPNHPATPDAA